MRKSLIKKGFTIVELVIVIAVIAVLAAVLIPTFSNVIDKANESAALTTAKNLYKEYVVENADTGKLLDDLYIEVDGGYIHYVKGEAVKEDDGKYVVTEIPDDAFVLPNNTLAIFKLGDDDIDKRNHLGGEINSYSLTVDGYTITLEELVKVFAPSYDNKGKACLKIGSGSSNGGFEMNVPDDVDSVAFYVSGFGDDSTTVDVTTKERVALLSANETSSITITTVSNDGKYTPIIVDTRYNKRIVFNSPRCMINTIKYLTEYIEFEEDDDANSATINFNDKSKRIFFSDNQQVWKENGVLVNNNKGDSSTNMGDYDNPVRFYKDSTISIKLVGKNEISKLEVICNTAGYATDLQNSIGQTAVVKGSLVTVNLPTDSFELSFKLNSQVRIDRIIVYYTDKVSSEECSHTESIIEKTEPTCTKSGLTEGKYCTDCGETILEQTIIPATGHTEEVLPAKEATCTETGLTKGKKCSVCEEILIAQNIIPKHHFVEGVCSECGEEEAFLLAAFSFGENGEATHDDGSSENSYLENNSDYTLSLTNVSNLYTGARDAKGNSCLKLGSSSKKGIINFEVPNNVTEVIIYVSKYKSNDSKITVNETVYTLTKNSNDGEYDEIKVDTSTNKSITLETTSGGYRCMINTVEFYGLDLIVPDAPEHTHTEEVLPGKDATCTETGLTEGKKCSECGEVLVAQEEIAMLEHDYVDGTCSVCGDNKTNLEEKKYVHTFTSKSYSSNGTMKLNEVDWTLAGDGNYWGYDSTKGQQLGSGNNPYKTMTMTSGVFNNVTKITINTSGASSVKATLSVYVNDIKVGENVTLSSTATDYTFETDEVITGTIKLVYNQTSSKALYIKSITVDYAE